MIDEQIIIEYIYKKKTDNSRVVFSEGWYICEGDKKIEILIDNELIHTISSFSERKDVYEHFDNNQNTLNSGYKFFIKIPENAKEIVLYNPTADSIIYQQVIANIVEKEDVIIESFIEDIYIDYSRSKPLLSIKGWAFGKIEEYSLPVLEVRLGKKILTKIELNGCRSDVNSAFPDFSNSKKSGFEITNCSIPKRGNIQLVINCGDMHKVISNYNIQELPTKHKSITMNKWNQIVCIMETTFRLAKKAWYIYTVKHKYKMGRAELKHYMLKAKGKLLSEMNRTQSYIASGLEVVDTYHVWLENNKLSLKVLQKLAASEKEFMYRPLISIIMPVYNVKKVWLEKAISSIDNQIYTNWEVCIADDCSTLTETTEYLRELKKKGEKYKVLFRSENGNISKATNSAVQLSSGEFILLMDNDDELAPNALFEIASILQEKRNIDIVYSDDDKMDENGLRYSPQFKPDWSPELLLSYMYFSHIFCMRRTLFDEVGGIRTGFEGTQDYDLALRITELTDRIHHIPKILYHWRAIQGSTASSANEKPEAFERAKKSIQEALERRNIKAVVHWPDFAKASSVGMFALEFPNEGPKVSIIIPTKNQLNMLKRCIDSISCTTYKNYEIVIVNNESDDPNIIEYFNMSPHKVLNIPNTEEGFSFAYMNNQAVDKIDSEYILFLNNDTEVIEPNWLSSMIGYQQFNGVGAVGARLLFPDNRVQHAGIIMGLYKGMAGPAFRLSPDWDPGYLGYSRVARNYSAVTAACLLTRKDYFLQVGGFDETHFAVAYNDVDLCLKLIKSGKRIVYVPDATLYHHEGVSRGHIDNPKEIEHFKYKYKRYVDSYYNKNLSLRNERFEISVSNTLDYDFNNNKTKLLMAAFNLNLEGAPFSQYELTEGLINLGNLEIEVYCPYDGPMRQRYENIGVKVHIFNHPLESAFSENEYNNSIDNFAKWIQNNQFDVVYGNTLQTFFLMDAANRLDKPCVWNIRESVDLLTYFNFLPAQIYRKGIEAIQYPYKTIFVAESTRELFEPYNIKHSFEVINNGLKIEHIDEYCNQYSREESKGKLNIPIDKKMFLIVGTVCERKGQLDFVKAAKRCIELNGKDSVFFIVGARQSDYLEEINNFIEQNQLDRDIRIVNETDNTALYYRAADIFVCCSYNESYPRVLLEAMAFELPIISTSVFGIREQLQENVNALYYKEGNIDELCTRMSDLLNDRDRLDKYAVNSRIVLNCLTSYDEMLLKYEEILLESALTKD